MFVEGKPVDGMEVFRYPRRGKALTLIVIGMIFGIPSYVALISTWPPGTWLGIFIYAGVLISIVASGAGLRTMFSIESLIVNRSNRWLRWSVKTPFSRKLRTIGFDELSHIRHITVTNSRREEGHYYFTDTALLVLNSGEKIVLGERIEVMSLSIRFSELTGVTIRHEDFSDGRSDSGDGAVI